MLHHLWQSFTDSPEHQADAIGGREVFTRFLTSPDPAVRKWAKECRDSFQSLRDSPDPELRGYYRQQVLHSRNLASTAWSTQQRGQCRQYLFGKDCKVRVSTRSGVNGLLSGDTIYCGMFPFFIHKEHGLQLEDGHNVSVQFHLAETEHPMRHVRYAQPTDPARRFAISISGHDATGEFHVWLQNRTRREKLTLKINSLVDILEGYTLVETKGFRRRWFVERVNRKYHDKYS